MTQNLSKYRELREDSLWTPEVIYEVQPPNQLVRDGYDYGEGDDGYDDGERERSLIDGVLDFFGNLFGDLGDILGGAAEAGVGFLVSVVEGVVSLFGSVVNAIGNAIGAFFGSPEPPEPLPDLYSPIQADLEAVMEPLFDKVSEALDGSAAAGADAGDAIGKIDVLLSDSADSPLWTLQQQVNRAVQERDEFQDIAIEANQRSIEAMQQYISRGMFLPDSSKVNSMENPHWMVTFSNGKRKLEAKPGWVGEWIYQSAVHRSGDFGPVIEGGQVTATGRTFSLDTATSSASLMYWVRPGEAKVFPEKGAPTPGGFSPAKDTWHRLNEFNFTAEQATEHSVHIWVGWNATTRTDSYGVRVLKNGDVIETLRQVGIGPWFPHENGYRRQTINLESVNLEKDDTLAFEILAGSNNESERRLRDANLQIGYVVPPGDSDVVTEAS